MADRGICSIEDCGNPVLAKMLCNAHYKKAFRKPRGIKRITPQGDALKWIYANCQYDGDECLKWPFGYRGKGGYGAVRNEHKKMIGAHVIMCIAAYSNNDGIKTLVAHSCGNGHEGCVNPRHLRWATAKENAEDRKIHGTEMYGEINKSSKLNRQQVEEIINLKGKKLQKEIAEIYGITKAYVGQIQRRETWRHIEYVD